MMFMLACQMARWTVKASVKDLYIQVAVWDSWSKEVGPTQCYPRFRLKS